MSGSKERASQSEAADLVHEHAHFHAALRGGDKMIQQFAAAGIVAPDEKLDVDVCARFIDALAKCGEKLRAVDEQSRGFGGGNGKFVDAREQFHRDAFLRRKSLQQSARARSDLAFFTRPRMQPSRGSRGAFSRTMRSVPKTK